MISLRKISFGLLAAVVVVGIASAAEPVKHNVVPKEGYVPNAETAISIAVAVWGPIYGSENIERQKPYKATLGDDGVWVVTGSLPKGWFGGVALAEIAKADGRVMRISHGR